MGVEVGDPVGPYWLDALTPRDCSVAVNWRNSEAVRPTLRTPHVLTDDMQAEFYRNVVCDRSSPHRYWAVRYATDTKSLEAVVGLTDISWENGAAEISLLVDPDASAADEIREAAVWLVLREAFERMRLLTVFGEMYATNPARGFWFEMLNAWPGKTGTTTIPCRKFWDGSLHDATLFWFCAP